MNQIFDNINNRRSIRKYKDTAISEKIIKQIIEAGRHAPSSHNSQPWRFIVITDRKVIKELSDMMKRWYKRLLVFEHFVVFNKGLKNLFEVVKKRVSNDKDLFFYDAPLLILICAEPKGFAMVDCACAAQNMMLAARSLGIGSCWIGFADMVVNKNRKLMAELGVPKECKVMAHLIFGYPAKFPERAFERKKEANIVKWI